MVEFKSFQMFLILMLPFTAVTQDYSSITVRVGDEVTLPCEDFKDLHDRCYSTTWIFDDSTNRPVVALFEYGKIHRAAAAKSDRLSVTEKCSLVITKVTHEDDGSYICLQFDESGQKVSDSRAHLFVINRADSPPPPPPPTTTATTTTTTTTPTTTSSSSSSTTCPTVAHKPGGWIRLIYVLVGVAALSMIVVSVNIWTRTKGYKTCCGKKQHNNEDDDVVTYENVEDVSAPVRFHRSTNIS